jgi:hypothetical protein
MIFNVCNTPFTSLHLDLKILPLANSATLYQYKELWKLLNGGHAQFDWRSFKEEVLSSNIQYLGGS